MHPSGNIAACNFAIRPDNAPMAAGKSKREAPWSVRGVSPEARSIAAIAAKKAGLSPGAWLSRAIFEELGKEAAGPKTSAEKPDIAITMTRDELTALYGFAEIGYMHSGREILSETDGETLRMVEEFRSTRRRIERLIFLNEP